MSSLLNINQFINDAYPPVVETIPKSSLGYKTNNVYNEFPPLMHDGRAVTASYQPEAVLNNHLLAQSGIKTNWEYRNYLTQNAKAILDQNFREAANDCGYFVRFGEPGTFQEVTTGTPYVYGSYLDNAPVLGVDKSDLKELYLSREQLNSRKVSPVITQDKILEWTGRSNH